MKELLTQDGGPPSLPRQHFTVWLCGSDGTIVQVISSNMDLGSPAILSSSWYPWICPTKAFNVKKQFHTVQSVDKGDLLELLLWQRNIFSYKGEVEG